MKFYKYHALGNDYLVLESTERTSSLTLEQIQRICHRNLGIGSDGILLGSPPSSNDPFSLKIFNPDGSEAEKSGNGLRIFSRYLWDQGRVKESPFTILTAGGKVQCKVQDQGRSITVEMGQIRFESKRIPLTGPSREVLNETLEVDGKEFTYCAATIGNPHCVVLCKTISEEETRHYGPLLENLERFPNRTNVQFLKVLDRTNIQIQIWERGAGYTLASGSSSCAAAAVAYKLGLCDNQISVYMPGGILEIDIAPDFWITMTGPVIQVAAGSLSAEIF